MNLLISILSAALNMILTLKMPSLTKSVIPFPCIKIIWRPLLFPYTPRPIIYLFPHPALFSYPALATWSQAFEPCALILRLTSCRHADQLRMIYYFICHKAKGPLIVIHNRHSDSCSISSLLPICCSTPFTLLPFQQNKIS